MTMTVHPTEPTYSAQTAAEALGLKSTRALYKHLRELHIIDERNQPTSHYRQWGLIQVVEKSVTLPGHNNIQKMYSTLAFSPRGIEFIRPLLKGRIA